MTIFVVVIVDKPNSLSDEVASVGANLSEFGPNNEFVTGLSKKVTSLKIVLTAPVIARAPQSGSGKLDQNMKVS